MTATSIQTTKTVIKKLATSVASGKIGTLMYKFNQSNQTSCQVDLNDIDGCTVMIKGNDNRHIDQAWNLFNKLAIQVESVKKEAKIGVETILEKLIYSSNRSMHRPSEVVNSTIFGRFSDGKIFLVNEGPLLVEAIDLLVRRFAKTERAIPFYAEPIWNPADLSDFGYPENSLDLCRLGHLDQEAHNYWQNAACDSIWKSLAGQKIEEFRTFTTLGTCCRNEQRQYYFLERLKTFRMREVVATGTPEEIMGFRTRAIDFIRKLNKELELNACFEKADDPFFIQDNTELDDISSKYDLPDIVKIEYRPEIYDGKSLACASSNVHGTFFSDNYKYRPINGAKSWTSCTAFGLERMAWAVLIQHGTDPRNWPEVLLRAIEFMRES